jgi:hypothetical protein
LRQNELRALASVGQTTGPLFAISPGKETDMTPSTHVTSDCFEILIGELMTDEELLDSFLRNPSRTLRNASEWGLPLSDSELQKLGTPAYRLRDKVADVLEARLAAAA